MHSTHHVTPLHVAPDRTLLRPAALSLALLVAVVAVAPTVAAQSGKPAPAASKVTQPAVLTEVRKQLVASGRFKPAEIESVVAELRTKNMDEIREIADFAGKAPTGANRLVGPGAATATRDRAGAIVGSSGGAGATAGSGGEQAVRGQLDGRGGVNDTRGRNAFGGIGQAGCMACPGDTIPEKQQAKQAGTESGGPINAKNGDVIQRWQEGSASIKRPNGTTEYINSAGRLVDANGKDVTPNPEDNTPAGSGRLTAADVRRIGALLGSRSEPDPDAGTGTGGGVDATRSNRTGTVGLYTEEGSATYVSRADVREIIRISVEKLQGPVAGQ